MANQKLKELMRDQIITFPDDIRKKLEYLASDEMFSYNYYKIDIYRQKLNFKQDDALLNAFIGSSTNVSTNEQHSFANAFMSTSSQQHSPVYKSRSSSTQINSIPTSSHTITPVKSDEELTTKDKMARLNAKLAALRGVSMPGDYLTKSHRS